MNQIKTKRLVLKKPTKKTNKKLIVSQIGDWEVAKWLSGVPYPYTEKKAEEWLHNICLLYTSPSPRDATLSRMPSSA